MNCCSITHPCGIFEGHCDNDNECFGNLSCGYNNCPPSIPNAYDCCYDPSGQITTTPMYGCFSESWVSTYSWVPNRRGVWNNSIGWIFPWKLINVGDEITVLGGKFWKSI